MQFAKPLAEPPVLDRALRPDLPKLLAAMLDNAATSSPYYRDQAWAQAVRRGASIALNEIPITAKSVVRADTERFHNPNVPPSEGRIRTYMTSGSTGQPMEVRHTQRSNKMNVFESNRLLAGWGIQQHEFAAGIRNPTPRDPQGTIRELLQLSGTLLRTLYSGDVEKAFDFIAKTGASLLYSGPQMALGILQHAADVGQSLPLRLIVTISEVVPEQLRAIVGALPTCRMVDKYSSIECGIIAVQCSICGAYHPADRHIVVEILDDRDQPAPAGKPGRVIVTPLFNMAMPLVRYETGDYAVVRAGPRCPESTLSLDRIVGRERNLFKLPTGERVMPWVDPGMARELGLRQYKLVQRTLSNIEFLYVPFDSAAELLQQRAQEVIDRCMAPGFSVRPVKVSELPRSASGKYLMHECLIAETKGPPAT
jgi:phenylacetate-CoA ligase